jgi:hypothetical protein
METTHRTQDFFLHTTPNIDLKRRVYDVIHDNRIDLIREVCFLRDNIHHIEACANSLDLKVNIRDRCDHALRILNK